MTIKWGTTAINWIRLYHPTTSCSHFFGVRRSVKGVLVRSEPATFDGALISTAAGTRDSAQPWLENLALDIGVCHEICSGELGKKSRKESRAAVGAPFTFTIAVRLASNIFTVLESILHLGGISTVNAVEVLLQPGE